ncbi:hypothetical protein [Nocardia uniformis]|nr:hypothetical protein [Nocardia uniformis]
MEIQNPIALAVTDTDYGLIADASISVLSRRLLRRRVFRVKP